MQESVYVCVWDMVSVDREERSRVRMREPARVEEDEEERSKNTKVARGFYMLCNWCPCM